MSGRGDTPPDRASGPLVLDRETLAAGDFRRRLRAVAAGVELWSEERIRRSLSETLAARPEPGGDVWLFAYGSLIWNPIIRFSERRIALLRGYHRRFCLRTVLGRGCRERPGLMLGLDHGGSCRGVAFRLPAAIAEPELLLVWRREMVAGAYRPRWLRARTAEGPLTVLAFTIERRHERYCRDLAEEERVAMLATASGALGRAADYLFDTARHLAELGIPDHHLERLCEAVRAYQERLRDGPNADRR
ncbi:MAG TPA: gamma-glutamylcyclotransferase [Rhodospirillales bacterium]|nr:gamma-glutamylcyclotransferase [Rhodospirillales bacterium]